MYRGLFHDISYDTPKIYVTYILIRKKYEKLAPRDGTYRHIPREDKYG